MLKNYYLLSLFFGSFRISYEELFTMVLSGGRAVRKDDKDLNWTCSGVGFVFMFYNQLVTERHGVGGHTHFYVDICRNDKTVILALRLGNKTVTEVIKIIMLMFIYQRSLVY